MVVRTAETLNRRRRRWIIAGLLLLMTCFAGWRLWPRGDARFVGKWTLHSLVVDLKSSGGGSATDATGKTVPIRWWVETDPVLCVNLGPAAGILGHFRALIGQAVPRFSRSSESEGRQMGFEIESIDANRIMYRPRSNGRSRTPLDEMVRVPDRRFGVRNSRYLRRRPGLPCSGAYVGLRPLEIVMRSARSRPPGWGARGG